MNATAEHCRLAIAVKSLIDSAKIREVGSEVRILALDHFFKTNKFSAESTPARILARWSMRRNFRASLLPDTVSVGLGFAPGLTRVPFISVNAIGVQK